MIMAVIFDMDGLLIDSEPLWQEAEIAAFQKVDTHLTIENCKETTGMRTDEVVEYWYQHRPWRGMSRSEMVEEITDNVIRLILERGKFKTGAEKAITLVKKQDARTALASSSNYRIIRAVLQKFNLSKEFEVIHSAQEEDYGKPHPAVYLTTSRKLNLPPESCLAIEDSLVGVIAAKAAKMTCLAVPEIADDRFVLADMQLRSLEELNETVWERLTENQK